MVLRSIALLAVAGVSCTGAVAAGVHEPAPALAAPRIPALPKRNESSGGRCPLPARFRPAFERAARDSGFQLSMLVAVAQVESSFHADARSSADARGLLQVLPSTGALLKLDVDKPVTNVLAGARYLRLLLDRYSRTDLALAAYNAGPTAVDRAGGVPSTQTMDYVLDVQHRWSTLAGCS